LYKHSWHFDLEGSTVIFNQE